MGLRSILFSAAAFLPIVAATAGAASAATTGSGNVAVIEPPTPHPNEAPCVVSLYQNAKFGANNANFAYTPPAGCPGPYAVIVLSVDVSLNAGIQYDRTGTLWVGGVPLWFGTTAEPSPGQAPSWHFERNVVDYTSLLATAQSGYALIANYTNSTDTSIITSSAKLLFYPATAKAPAPRVPDMIIPLAAPGGGTVGLGSSTSVLTITPTLPKNIEAASLDVYLQGQSGDEFWYTCVPTALAGELESCPGGTVREGEISIDSTPAGVAPVSPWIFTGGIDPYLWSPIPGVQTLDFRPFRVPLSPFAGVLSNGAPHSINLSVFGADNYFSVAGALFLYLDSGTAQVTGGVTKNTLAATPVVQNTENINSTSSLVSGTVDTKEVRGFTIAGNVTGSHGTITYQVDQSIKFTNDQRFAIPASGATYLQNIKQDTTTVVAQTTTEASGKTTVHTVTRTTPLNVAIYEAFNAAGNGYQKTTISQLFANTSKVLLNGALADQSSYTDSITTADKLLLNSSYQITGNEGQSSSASLETKGTNMPCFAQRLVSSSGILIYDATGCQ